MPAPRRPAPRPRPKWLPEPATPPALPRRLWRPPSLGDTNVDYKQLWYVLVEEKVDGVLGIRLAPWPRAGDDGLPVFAEPIHELEVGAAEEQLQARLNRVRRPP